MEAYAHQDLPFEQLVKILKSERHISHAPLVGIAIAKAVLVILFFMHLRYTRVWTIFLILGTILLLLILMGLTGIDHLTRVNGLPIPH